MKVLNLQCGQSHGFEGWFGSEDDYQSQRSRGLVSCPLCGDAQIVKLPSAPRLNLGAAEPSATSVGQPTENGQVAGVTSNAAHAANTLQQVPGTSGMPVPTRQEPTSWGMQQMQVALMQAVKHVLAHTEDVGTQFADEARKMHYGEAQERGIRGQVTREETEALLDEGIEVMALPMLESLKGPLQ